MHYLQLSVAMLSKEPGTYLDVGKSEAGESSRGKAKIWPSSHQNAA